MQSAALYSGGQRTALPENPTPESTVHYYFMLVGLARQADPLHHALCRGAPASYRPGALLVR